MAGSKQVATFMLQEEFSFSATQKLRKSSKLNGILMQIN